MTDDLFASPKSRLVAQLLAVFLGVFGAHRFYVGKVQTGILQACTLGGLGLWYLYDNILIAAGSFRDSEGNLVANWEPESDRLIPPGTAAAIFDELDALRAEVTELQDRVAFAERMIEPASRRDSTQA
ncbi:MAG: TM2 domain-containing protein [Gemmatimonadales bacterium]|nr:TM2 domain-containing protein [Gemmatimonadota bacterium]MBP9899517.1 TM2 domain-containing protein [Gemmatimonadales bacterium]